MIIGISGKKQHGKDAIGNIMLQYLSPGWEKKRFSEKLKQIVCLLIGCTMEQLEDNVFKEKELGEEWDLWRWKDKRYEIYSPYYTSDKEAEIFKLSEEYIRKWIPYPPGVVVLHKDKMTPRKLLQLIGTDAGRNIVHPNIWVNALMSEYKPYIENYPQLIKSDGKDLIVGTQYNMGKAVLPNWIITDVRFENEIQAIKRRGGIVIRVYRDMKYFLCDKCGADDIKPYELTLEDTCPRCNYHSEDNLTMVIPNEDNHLSETALDNYQGFDYVIENNSDIGELCKAVKDILRKQKIIQ